MLQTKLTKLAQNTILRLLIKLMWFKEIFDEYSEEKSKYFYDKTHRIKVFEYLILCVFLILKIFPRLFVLLYSMKIKEQTRKLAAVCSKHCFEVADRTD